LPSLSTHERHACSFCAVDLALHLDSLNFLFGSMAKAGPFTPPLEAMVSEGISDRRESESVICENSAIYAKTSRHRKEDIFAWSPAAEGTANAFQGNLSHFRHHATNPLALIPSFIKSLTTADSDTPRASASCSTISRATVGIKTVIKLLI
jgi:hypothetical protein